MSDVGNVHSNDVESELEGVMRTLIAAAGRMGENIARMREEAARRAEAHSTQRAREVQAQFEQERAVARTQLLPTREPAWWDRTRPEDVAHAYETAAAWKNTDPDLAQAHAHMGDELRERYGIDVNDVQADPRRVAEILNQRPALIDSPEHAGSREQGRREANQLLRAADEHDRTAETARLNAAATRNHEECAGNEDHAEGVAVWDSADRRDAHARTMAEQGVDAIAVQAQYGADISNANHPRSAVHPTRGASVARKTSPRAAKVTRDRGERSR